MSSSILHPPAQLPPSVALQLSQQAPGILANAPSTVSAYSLSSLFSAAESPELWTTYENLMLSCLRTGDRSSAHKCLERLSNRFGSDNERLMALRGLYQEATAENDAALNEVMLQYDEILERDPSNLPVSKRRIALLKSTGRISDAIHALTHFLETSPTDAEAWAELSDLYATQGLYAQSIFSLEEVLLITPNAWNVHARLGEVLYTAANAGTTSTADLSSERSLADSIRRFSRSIELCDDYLRGYYGLKLATGKLLSIYPKASKQQKGDTSIVVPELKTVQALHELATAKLSEIVRRGLAREAGWEGYDAAELIAARALLDKDVVSKTH